MKQGLERDAGIPPTVARVFVSDDARKTELRNDETLGSLRQAKKAKVEIAVLVVHADAQQVVSALPPNADLVLGKKNYEVSFAEKCKARNTVVNNLACALAVGAGIGLCGAAAAGIGLAAAGIGLTAAMSSLRKTPSVSNHRPVTHPTAVVFVPSHPDWLVVADGGGPQVGCSSLGLSLACGYSMFKQERWSVLSVLCRVMRRYMILQSPLTAHLFLSRHPHAFPPWLVLQMAPGVVA
jgi:hypothetical protein